MGEERAVRDLVLKWSDRAGWVALLVVVVFAVITWCTGINTDVVQYAGMGVELVAWLVLPLLPPRVWRWVANRR